VSNEAKLGSFYTEKSTPPAWATCDPTIGTWATPVFQ
jgi:hypothetical protein